MVNIIFNTNAGKTILILCNGKKNNLTNFVE